MIDRARANFGEPAGLRWVVRGFDQPITLTEPFDAAVCVGNSLALAPDAATVRRAMGQMSAAVRRGGLLIVHILNLWHLPDGPCVWQKCRLASLPQGESLVIKGIHRCGARGYVDLIVVAPAAAGEMRNSCVPFLGLEAEELASLAREAGACNLQLFGDYRNAPYAREASADLLMVAERG
jgi:hypothetical protein